MVGAPLSLSGNQAQPLRFGANGDGQEGSDSAAKYAPPPAQYAMPNATISTLLPYNGLPPSAAPPYNAAMAYPASSFPNPTPVVTNSSMGFPTNPAVLWPYNTQPSNPAGGPSNHSTYPPNPGLNSASVYPSPQSSAAHPSQPVPPPVSTPYPQSSAAYTCQPAPPASAPYSQPPAYPPQPASPATAHFQSPGYPPQQTQVAPPAGYPPHPPPGAPTGYPSVSPSGTYPPPGPPPSSEYHQQSNSTSQSAPTMGAYPPPPVACATYPPCPY